MKKKTIRFSIIILSIFQLSLGQNYQKSFGKVEGTENSDQQQFYDVLNYNEQSLLNSGTFRNISTFPEIAFYGTLSNLNKNGDVNWYKGYLPTNFQPFDSFFINSIVKNESGEIYAIGNLMTVDVNSGYILMKFNSSGEVLFSKKISDELPSSDVKIVMNNGNIFGILGNKIVKFDLNGNIIKSISSFTMQFRDITFDTNDNIVCVGDYIDSDPVGGSNVGLPVIRLTTDLDFVNGTVFQSEILGSFYAHSVVSYSTENTIIGGPLIYFSLDSNNAIQWAKSVPTNFVQPPVSDSYGSFLDFKKNNQDLYFLVTGFYSNDEGTFGNSANATPNNEPVFQYYSAFGKINPITGEMLNSKDIKEGHFDFIDHIQLNSFIIDNNSIFGSGRTTNFYGEYHLNYIHKTSLTELGCGEMNRNASVEEISQNITSFNLPSDTFESITLNGETIQMVTVNIPINYENQSCSSTLGIVDNNLEEVTIFPNPSSSFITIDGVENIYSIEVIDNLGRKISSFQKSPDKQYDVSTLNAGLYYLKIITNEKTVRVAKFIKD